MGFDAFWPTFGPPNPTFYSLLASFRGLTKSHLKPTLSGNKLFSKQGPEAAQQNGNISVNCCSAVFCKPWTSNFRTGANLVSHRCTKLLGDELSGPRHRNHKSLAIANHNFEVASFSRRNRNEIAVSEVFSELQWFFELRLQSLAICDSRSLRFGSLRRRISLLKIAWRMLISFACT